MCRGGENEKRLVSEGPEERMGKRVQMMRKGWLSGERKGGYQECVGGEDEKGLVSEGPVEGKGRYPGCG